MGRERVASLRAERLEKLWMQGVFSRTGVCWGQGTKVWCALIVAVGWLYPLQEHLIP